MKLNLTIVLLSLATILTACATQPTSTAMLSVSEYEGLQQVPAKTFDVALIRPGIDFSKYREIRLHDAQLGFKTPDRSLLQFPLSTEQKERFRTLLDKGFRAELVDLKNLALTDNPGPAVLDLYVRVQDISATVPPRTVGSTGRSQIALQALGEATLIIELRDSQSEEILARVFDRRIIDGIAVAQKQAGPVTSWEDVDTVCVGWAVSAKNSLEVLISGKY